MNKSSAFTDGFRWSFSKLEAFEHCPMMFKLVYLDGHPAFGNAFSEYGTFCHGLLEEWAKGECSAIALAEEYERRYDEAVVHTFPPFPKGMADKYYEAGLRYFESFMGFDGYDILAAEEKFVVDIGDYPVSGVVDLVLRNQETGEITVIDHKSKSAATMKKDLDIYRRQLYIYAAYVKRKYGYFPTRLSFNLFREGSFIHEDFDPAQFEATMTWVVRTIEQILFETDWKALPSSYFCQFVCDVATECPVFQEDG